MDILVTITVSKKPEQWLSEQWLWIVVIDGETTSGYQTTYWDAQCAANEVLRNVGIDV